MRYSLLFLAFMALASLAPAQNAATDFKYGLKLSNQISWNYRRIRDTNGNVVSGGNVSLFNVQPGFLLKGSKGNFWDFSLQTLRCNLNGRFAGTQLYNMGLGAKVGYFYSFFKRKNTQWIPMLGLEVAPTFGMSRNRVVNQPTSSTSTFIASRTQMGGELFLTPRVMWCPGKRFFMDASINIGLLQGNFIHSETSDPSVANSVRNISRLGLPLDGARLNIGFGLKI